MISSEAVSQFIQWQAPVLALTLKIILLAVPFVVLLDERAPSKGKG